MCASSAYARRMTPEQREILLTAIDAWVSDYHKVDGFLRWHRNIAVARQEPEMVFPHAGWDAEHFCTSQIGMDALRRIFQDDQSALDAAETPLAQAAAGLRSMISRVSGGPGADGTDWLHQVEAGEWDGRLPPDDAEAVRDLLLVVTERLRHARSVAGEAEETRDRAAIRPLAGTGFQAASQSRLPMNRKERYFTGTVLPGLVAADGLIHLPRFLALCDLAVTLPAEEHGLLEGAQDVQFFTEYAFAESIVGADKERFAGAPSERDTPDLVVCGSDWLLAVEAKVFHRPTAEALDGQMRRQAPLVAYWARRLGIEESRTRHVLLLPQALAESRSGLDWQVKTWEAVADAFAVAGDGYWLGVLRAALRDYDKLASPEPTFGANAQGRLTGAEILDDLKAPAPVHGWVGRVGGLDGEAFGDDCTTGSWVTRTYEVRKDPPPERNPNWFTTGQFAAAVASVSVTGND